MARKLPKIRTIIHRLDPKFSRMRRLQEADKDGYCKCCTCYAIKHWKEMDAGHYVNRDIWWTRYVKQNVHPQCKQCNRFKSGRHARYGKFIGDRYGSDRRTELEELAWKTDNRTSVEKVGWLLEIEAEVDAELKDLQ